MRARDCGDLVPEDCPGFAGTRHVGVVKGELFNALREKVNFAVIDERQAIEEFGEGAFRPVAAIDKRGDDGDTQISGSMPDGAKLPEYSWRAK